MSEFEKWWHALEGDFDRWCDFCASVEWANLCMKVGQKKADEIRPTLLKRVRRRERRRIAREVRLNFGAGI